MEKLRWEIRIPLEGDSSSWINLCQCESVDAVLAVLHGIMRKDANGPEKIQVNQIKVDVP